MKTLARCLGFSVAILGAALLYVGIRVGAATLDEAPKHWRRKGA